MARGWCSALQVSRALPELPSGEGARQLPEAPQGVRDECSEAQTTKSHEEEVRWGEGEGGGEVEGESEGTERDRHGRYTWPCLLSAVTS